MDQLDANNNDGMEEVVNIDHGVKEVVLQPSPKPVVSNNPQPTASGQQPTGIGSSDISSKYSEEIAKIKESYSQNIEDSHAQNFHADTQQTPPDRNRGLYSNEFQAPPQSQIPNVATNAVVYSESEATKKINEDRADTELNTNISPEQLQVDQQPQQPVQFTVPDTKADNIYVYQDPTELLTNPAPPLSGESPKLKRFNLALLPFFGLALVLIAVGVFLFIKSSGGTAMNKFNLSNGGYSYSLDFYKDGEVSISNGVQYLQSTSTQAGGSLYVQPQKSIDDSCIAEYPALNVVFYITVSGKSYPACTDKNLNLVFTNFYYDNVWMQMDLNTVSSASIVNLKDAINIFNSIKVTKD
jgi:hypothetical protein